MVRGMDMYQIVDHSGTIIGSFESKSEALEARNARETSYRSAVGSCLVIRHGY